MRSIDSFKWILVVSLGAVGCTGNISDPPAAQEGVAGVASPDNSQDVPVTFTPVADDIGSAGQTETRELFTSEAAYEAYFGHAAPASVDFQNEDVVFYSAGSVPTSGYSASIEKITTSASGLQITTALVSPGSGCAAVQGSTTPFALVKFAKPQGAPSHDFKLDDSITYCGACPRSNQCPAGSHWDNTPDVCSCQPGAPDPCEGVPCPTGTTCGIENGYAVCMN
jgi:hypothetical protein